MDGLGERHHRTLVAAGLLFGRQCVPYDSVIRGSTQGGCLVVGQFESSATISSIFQT
jgi:hypothetical protein